ncbi:unnamed protein product [Ambrosiozyma monospora]|uniref:Unnamed protein product n=1 Tax=Ambrosiozyma monospora TaxID=43982 RepID=A0ACB5T057_AMBMO|nr:unnamed protein product [Ambrosiozyma monospora]
MASLFRSHNIRKTALLSIGIFFLMMLIFKVSSDTTPDLADLLTQAGTVVDPNEELRKNTNGNNNDKSGSSDGNSGGSNHHLAGLSFTGSRKQNEELELAKKLNELTEKLLDDQEVRLKKLEKDRLQLEKQLNELRRPHQDATLRERLAYMFPYDQDRKFPAYIWQSWKYGLNDERFGPKYKKGEEQWAVKNPGFVHELFNDDTSNAIVHYVYMNIPEVVRAYELMPHVVLKMDFFRYLMLFAKGGVYADVDTLPLQPIPNWIPENVEPSEIGMIIAIQSDPNSQDWREHYARRLQFGNWVIQAKPGHPILREMIATVLEFGRM